MVSGPKLTNAYGSTFKVSVVVQLFWVDDIQYVPDSVTLKNDTQDIYPYVFNPIQMLAGTATLYETTNQLVQLKFKFIQAVNQRTPRY